MTAEKTGVLASIDVGAESYMTALRFKDGDVMVTFNFPGLLQLNKEVKVEYYLTDAIQPLIIRSLQWEGIRLEETPSDPQRIEIKVGELESVHISEGRHQFTMFQFVDGTIIVAQQIVGLTPTSGLVELKYQIRGCGLPVNLVSVKRIQ